MSGKLFTLYGNLSIRNKLILGFAVLITILLIVIGVNVLIKDQTTDPAHDSLYNSMQEIMLSRQFSREFGEMRNMEQEFIAQYLAYGYNGVYELYQAKLPHMDAALGYLDQLTGLIGTEAGRSDPNTEETTDIASIQESANAYKEILSEMADKINLHGTVERDLGGNVVLPLNQINAVVDASTAIAAATKYINQFDPVSATKFPDDIAALKADIEAADLPADQQAELTALADQSQEAFSALTSSDLVLVARYMSLNPLGETMTAKIDEFIKAEEVNVASAQTKLDDAEKLQTRLIWLLAILAMVTVLGLAWLMSRIIAQPVSELTNIAQKIAAGDYQQRATVRYTDETGQLAQSFNAMIGAVSDREAQLRDQTEQLRIATARAKEAARIKGEFLANVSHELRTPLNAIIGYSDMLTMGMCGEMTEKQNQKVVRLRENGVRLLNLINDILDITRIEARRIEILSKPFAPQALFDRLSTQMEVLAQEKGLEFKTEIAPGLPPTLVGDEKRIEQIVVNLLSNAFKFTQQGQVNLKVGTNVAEKTWTVAVSDTGIGIPPHARELIFEEFRQLDGASTRAYAGTGLGLAITRNLVRIMDGQISVDSELGKGSTFTVTLPLVLDGSLEKV
jgi:signal transduction histidine kinase